jgi:glycolate oxidase
MEGLGKDLRRILAGRQVLDSPEDCLAYANDATHYYWQQSPAAVVLPLTVEDVSRVLKYAGQNQVPVTPRGAGSGLAGGCTPVKGGIVLDMKRMNALVELDESNLTARVEPGLVHALFTRKVEKRGLFYPPDPQSMSVCTLGGNVATRAGGPRGVKYGTTANYVLGLQAVLPDGSIIETGGKVVKQSVGYNLTQLLTGSEGTLAVITGINLRLLPLPAAHRTIMVACESPDQAAQLVASIIKSGTIPAMLEFLISAAVAIMNNYITPPLPVDAGAYLLIETDGSLVQVEEDSRQILSLCEEMKVREARLIIDEAEAQSYWTARARLYPLLMTIMKRVITEDITVPRNRIPDLVRAVQEIASRCAIGIGLAGHAGDGNMHPTILQGDLSAETLSKAKTAIDQMIIKGLELQGTISGEHGIGLHKQEYLEWELGTKQIELLKRIKKAFDPNNLMNPGKIWNKGGGLL